MQPVLGELQKQAKRVPIGTDGVRTGLPLIHQTLGEEPVQKNAEAGLAGHDDSPHRRSSRAIAWAISSGLPLRYQ